MILFSLSSNRGYRFYLVMVGIYYYIHNISDILIIYTLMYIHEFLNKTKMPSTIIMLNEKEGI